MNERSAQIMQPNSTKKSNPVLRGLLVLAMVAFALLAVKYLSDSIIPDVPGVVLNDMHSIEDVRARFNQDYGAPRLILLLSPT